MSGLRHHEPADRGRDQAESRYVPRSDASERLLRQERLTQTIETEIIPRLMLAHRTTGAAPGDAARSIAVPEAQDVVDLSERLLDADPTRAATYVHALRRRGMPLDVLFLDLLAPAARRLGELWDADLCDFVDVTMGLSRLQQLLREFGPAFEEDGPAAAAARRILLMPGPGENHTFGLALVEQFFRRGGWDVWTEGPLTVDEIAALLRSAWFAAVGLSVSGDRLLEQLTTAIRAVRKESLNPEIVVLVGGPMFVACPEAAAAVGADATALDARDAVRQAQTLLGLVGVAADC